ncbi:hypothetical protein EON65_38710 [archaeon]|nr:MAG: hypothetical protein EON65_38710 [archaeon]
MKALPDDFLLYFYRNWLELVDFVKLDSALTEQKARVHQRKLISNAIQPQIVARTISKLQQCDQGYIQAALLDSVPLLSILTYLSGLGYATANKSGIRISFTPSFFQEFELKYKGETFPLVEGAMVDGVNWNNETLRMYRVFDLFPNITSLSIHCISKSTLFYQSFFEGVQKSKVTSITVLSRDLYPSYSLSFLTYITVFAGHSLEVSTVSR